MPCCCCVILEAANESPQFQSARPPLSTTPYLGGEVGGARGAAVWLFLPLGSVPRKSNRQDSSHAGVSWLSRERGEVTNRCRCSSRHRCRAVGYLALWVLGVAGYLASLHGGADLDVRVDGHLDVPISYLSLGELRWLPRLAYTVVQFERWNTAGCAISFCYSHWRILDGRHIGAARDGLSHVGFFVPFHMGSTVLHGSSSSVRRSDGDPDRNLVS